MSPLQQKRYQLWAGFLTVIGMEIAFVIYFPGIYHDIMSDNAAKETEKLHWILGLVYHWGGPKVAVGVVLLLMVVIGYGIYEGVRELRRAY